MAEQRSDRDQLIDILAAGDGQNWPDFWENVGQRENGRTMYGAQADELLASSWLAERDRRALRAETRAAESAADAYRDAADEVHREIRWQWMDHRRQWSRDQDVVSIPRLEMLEQIFRDRADQVAALGAEPAKVQP